jgi:hypothetical protein
MGMSFELWVRLALGDIYAIRRVADSVVGVCGPIPLDALATLDLSSCQYADPRQTVRLDMLRRGEFVPAERWVLGFENQAIVLGALARAARSVRSESNP